jgi:superfamily II DNA or RNA helicase
MTENQLKGAAYEKFIVEHLQSEGKTAYLWNDAPEEYLIDYLGILQSSKEGRELRRMQKVYPKFRNKKSAVNKEKDADGSMLEKVNTFIDTGVDIVVVSHNELVQCKNGYEKGLRIEDCAGFFAWISMCKSQCSGCYLYYTSKLTRNLKFFFDNDAEKKLIAVKKPFITNTETEKMAVDESEKMAVDDPERMAVVESEKFVVAAEPEKFVVDEARLKFQVDAANRIIEYYEEDQSEMSYDEYDEESSCSDADADADSDAVSDYDDFYIDGLSDDEVDTSNFKGVDFDIESDYLSDSEGSSADTTPKKKDRGILQMPCGVGKTYTTYLAAIAYKVIIYFTPLRQFVQQTRDRFIQYGYKVPSLIVDSDGVRDAAEIKKFISKSEKYALFATFKSADVISAVISELNIADCLIVIDEFHNLSLSQITPATEATKQDPMYKILNSNNKVLYVSATPRVYDIEDQHSDLEMSESYRKMFGDIIYEMSFAEARKAGFITDYLLFLPNINEETDELCSDLAAYNLDSTLQNKCMYIYACLANYGKRKSIVYCEDTASLKALRDALVGMSDYYAIPFKTAQIIAETSFAERQRILSDFTTAAERYLLFGVRILDECIDIPACDSIFITYPCSSKIRTIQRLSRAIRLNSREPDKVAHCYAWCSSYYDILTTLSNLKEFDADLIEKVKLCQYDKQRFLSDKKKAVLAANVETTKKYIVGVREYNDEMWYDNLEEVKKYIREHGRRPVGGKTEMGRWLANQLTNYKYVREGMKNIDRYKKFSEFLEEFKEYFRTTEEIWYSKLEELKKYIDENKKRPNAMKTQIGRWLVRQIKNYKRKNDILKHPKIYACFTQFLQDYNEYFIPNEEMWYNNLEEVKKYIDENNQRPNSNNTQLGKWLSCQLKNYKKKLQIMKQQEIYVCFTQFLQDYSEYFISNEEKWYKKLNEVKKYIDENKQRPNTMKTLIGRWTTLQIKTYNKQSGIMKQKEIYDEFAKFLKDYNNYFTSNEEIWYSNLEKVKKYINENKKKPSIEDRLLGKWLSTQLHNYKKKTQIMKQKEIYNEFSQFLQDYDEYFVSNEEVWHNNLEEVKKYINENKKRPICKKTKLGVWLSIQLENYKKKTQIMKQKEIYDCFTQFLQDYNEYFISNEEVWYNNLEEVKKYIDENNQRPNCNNDQLGRWLSNQLKKHKKKTEIMKQQEIYDCFTQFLQDYNEYFMPREEAWYDKLEEIKEYIDKNKQRPVARNYLGRWLNTQLQNYKNKINIMKNEEIYNAFTQFLKDYKEYFPTYDATLTTTS